MDKHLKLVPLVFFSALSIKLIATGISISDAPVLLILALCSIYYEFKIENKKLTAFEAKISKLEEHLQARSKEIDEIKTSISSVRLAQSMRSTTIGNR